jgi:glycosyltransferase involved in cell wall biosynthesis
MIGIGVTVHNRNETAQKTIAAIRKFAPEQPHRIVIVDDASTTPIPGATFRFEYNVGIARAKNKCIQLLQDCDELFLFDDDCRPIAKGWETPYQEAPADLISLNWSHYQDGTATGNNELNRIGGLVYFYRPCGVLLYARRKIWEEIGGMDQAYIRWGYEHVEWARRAWNRGLIPYPYIGIQNPLEKVEADDYITKLEESTTPRATRSLYVYNSQLRFENTQQNRQFIEFRTNESETKESAVLASYFCKSPDPQRQKRWTNTLQEVKALLVSLEKFGHPLVLFTDMDPANIDLHSPHLQIVHTQVDRRFNPVDFRWIAYRDWLLKNPVKKIWMVDSTDVEAQSDPFKIIAPGKIYVGEEYNQNLANRWLEQTCGPIMRNLPDYQALIAKNRNQILLNAGIVGGELLEVSQFLNDFNLILYRLVRRYGNLIDMAVLNYLACLKYRDKIEHGTHITSKFKDYETDSSAIWKHK